MIKNGIRTLSAAALMLSANAFAAPPSAGLDDAILDLTHRWAKVTYKTPADAQPAGFKELIAASDRVAAAYPGRAEPMVWQAIALSSDAKADGGLNALGEVRRARDLLLAAEKIDPTVLAGSIYASLGALYANVPGWPVGYGDATTARKYLEQALQVNPTGIDQNYLYAEFLANKGEYAKAYGRLRLALSAPPRANREDSDGGRREEAQRLIDELRRKHGDQLAAN